MKKIFIKMIITSVTVFSMMVGLAGCDTKKPAAESSDTTPTTSIEESTVADEEDTTTNHKEEITTKQPNTNNATTTTKKPNNNKPSGNNSTTATTATNKPSTNDNYSNDPTYLKGPYGQWFDADTEMDEYLAAWEEYYKIEEEKKYIDRWGNPIAGKVVNGVTHYVGPNDTIFKDRDDCLEAWESAFGFWCVDGNEEEGQWIWVFDNGEGGVTFNYEDYLLLKQNPDYVYLDYEFGKGRVVKSYEPIISYGWSSSPFKSDFKEGIIEDINLDEDIYAPYVYYYDGRVCNASYSVVARYYYGDMYYKVIELDGSETLTLRENLLFNPINCDMLMAMSLKKMHFTGSDGRKYIHYTFSLFTNEDNLNDWKHDDLLNIFYDTMDEMPGNGIDTLKEYFNIKGRPKLVYKPSTDESGGNYIVEFKLYEDGSIELVQSED